MAITAAITLSSAAGDLLTNALALSTKSSLSKAGAATALAQTGGLGRKATIALDQFTLFRADEYTEDKAHKVFLNNTSTNTAYYYEIFIASQSVGRIYGGDFALLPWSAKDGTREIFTLTCSGTWQAVDTLTFDGVTVTANTAHATTAANVRAAKFPNWVVTGAGSDAIFTSKIARADQEIDVGHWTLVDAASTDAGIAIATTQEGQANAGDLKITPGGSGVNEVILEYMLFNE